MTSFTDQFRNGAANFSRAVATTTPGFILGYAEDEIYGVPNCAMYTYPIGTASTSLASGIAFSASGFGTLTGSAVTISITGSLVSNGVAVLDVPRAVAVFCTLSITGSTFTIIGTDFYGQTQKATFTGAAGGAAFATTGMAVSPVAFKTITSASYTATTATGTSTTSVQIGTTDWYGVPYRLSSKNRVVSMTMDGFPIFATIPGTVVGAIGGGVITGLATTVTPTASTADVRGMIGFPTNFIADGTRTFAINVVSPAFNVTKANDIKETTYGVTPFSG